MGFPARRDRDRRPRVCGFAVKVANAQAARAVGVIVANNAPGTPITMGGVDPTITIPAVMVSQADGATVKAGLPATGGIAAERSAARVRYRSAHDQHRRPDQADLRRVLRRTRHLHDTQCIVYDGPDGDYRGREICFNSNANEQRSRRPAQVSIVDVTDKANPVALSRVGSANDGYSHQGCLTPDRRLLPPR